MPRTPALLLLLTLSACHRSDPLRLAIRSHCDEQRTGLELALEKAKRDGRLPEYSLIGAPSLRAAAAQLHREFSFCAEVRALPGEERSSLRTRFHRAADELLTSGRDDAPAARAAVQEMVDLYRSLDARPLLD